MIAALWLASPSSAQDTPEAPPVEAPAADPVAAEPPDALAGEPTPASPRGPVAEQAVPEAVPTVPAKSERFPRASVDAELGSIGNYDPGYDLFSDRNAMGDWGFRLGYRLLEGVQVRAGWHLARHGADVQLPVDETDADFTSSTQSFRSALIADEATVGLRVDTTVQDVLQPYVAVDGLVFASRIRLDDDPEDPKNPGQVQRTGYAPGLLGMGGVELRVPPGGKVVGAWTLEMGYAWIAPVSYGTIGRMQPGGFAVRSGLGVRF